MANEIHIEERLFEISPFGILVFDDQNKIRSLNPTLKDLLHIDGQGVVGKDQASVEAIYRPLFDDTDMLHLTFDDEREVWLHRDIKQVDEPHNGSMKVHFFQDVSALVKLNSQRDELLEQVEALRTTDELTGIPNQRSIMQMLEQQVSRSRRYGNLLTISLIQVSISESTAKQTDHILIAFTQFMRERLRWADLIGRLSADQLLIIMPETTATDATNLLTGMQNELEEHGLENTASSPEFRFSVQSWEKGDDARRLIRRATEQWSQ